MWSQTSLSGTSERLAENGWETLCFRHSAGRGVDTALFVAQQLQLVLVFCKQSLETQVLADDGQNLPQQIPLP